MRKKHKRHSGRSHSHLFAGIAVAMALVLAPLTYFNADMGEFLGAQTQLQPAVRSFGVVYPLGVTGNFPYILKNTDPLLPFTKFQGTGNEVIEDVPVGSYSLTIDTVLGGSRFMTGVFDGGSENPFTPFSIVIPPGEGTFEFDVPAGNLTIQYDLPPGVAITPSAFRHVVKNFNREGITSVFQGDGNIEHLLEGNYLLEILPPQGFALKNRLVQTDGDISQHMIVAVSQNASPSIIVGIELAPITATLNPRIGAENVQVVLPDGPITNPNSATLDLGATGSSNPTLVALRFPRSSQLLQIPQNARIESAHLQFTSAFENTGSASFTIKGQSGSSASLDSQPLNTTISVPWNINSAWGANERTDLQKSPDLQNIVQGIVDAPFSSFDLFLSGTTGRRAVKSAGSSRVFQVSPLVEDPHGHSPHLIIVYYLPQVTPPAGTIPPAPPLPPGEDDDGDGVVDSEDKLIGSASDVVSESFSNLLRPVVTVSNEPNLDQDFSGNPLIQVREGGPGGRQRVEFNFNLDATQLDLRKISIKKQESGDNRGFLVVSGLEGVTKTVYVDRLVEGNTHVCVKNSEEATVESISPACTLTDETFLDCEFPNSPCSLLPSTNQYVVEGLQNSAVLEFVTAAASGDGDAGTGDDPPSGNQGSPPSQPDVFACVDDIDNDADGLIDEFDVGCAVGDQTDDDESNGTIIVNFEPLPSGVTQEDVDFSIEIGSSDVGFLSERTDLATSSRRVLEVPFADNYNFSVRVTRPGFGTEFSPRSFNISPSPEADTETVAVTVFTRPKCANGIDDDTDGFVDMTDRGCTDRDDNDEKDPLVFPAPRAGFPIRVFFDNIRAQGRQLKSGTDFTFKPGDDNENGFLCEDSVEGSLLGLGLICFFEEETEASIIISPKPNGEFLGQFEELSFSLAVEDRLVDVPRSLPVRLERANLMERFLEHLSASSLSLLQSNLQTYKAFINVILQNP